MKNRSLSLLLPVSILAASLLLTGCDETLVVTRRGPVYAEPQPVYYRPYQPYYESEVVMLPRTAQVVTYRGRPAWYWNGSYYRRTRGGYMVIR